LDMFGHLDRQAIGQKGKGGIEIDMRTEIHTVEDSMATIQAHLILKFLLTMCLVGIPRVGNPAVGLHESSGSEVLVLVPPVGRARGRTAGAEDTFI